MNLLTNPFVWLGRIRHRCGYGVHSPFAFHFITDVVYERLPYYSYEGLDGMLQWYQRFRVRRLLHLLLRVSNFQQPKVTVVNERCPLAMAYLYAGCRSTQVKMLEETAKADLCFLTKPDERAVEVMAEGGILLLDNLQRHRQWFRALPATLFFDLHDLGIAIFGVPYHKQYYVVNF